MIEGAGPGGGPILIRPKFQRYAWGDARYIPEMFGIPDTSRTPWAEAWFGAHAALPSGAVVNGQEIPLDRLIADRSEILSKASATRFGGLPYLLKVIAAARPLSIQVHPSRSQAEEGFRRESEIGIPIDAPQRNYRDRNHKPELLVALTDFHILCGFRPLAEINSVLGRLPEIASILPPYEPSPTGLRRVIDAYFALSKDRVSDALRRLIDRLSSENEAGPPHSDDPAFWALIADSEFSRPEDADPGILFVFLLNLIRLAPGEAVFLEAGVLHSYLRGAGVEVMANSDNVVRCGLTPKPVNVPELLRIVNFEGGSIPRVIPMPAGDGEIIYRPPADEFELGRLHLRPDAGESWGMAEGEELLVVLGNGPQVRVTVRSKEAECVVSRGGACIVPSGLDYSIRASESAVIFRVRTPGGDERVERIDAGTAFRGRVPRRLGFGTSGLRGLVADLTDLEAYINTCGFLEFLVAGGITTRGGPVAIAGDLRVSTDSPDRSILRAVNRGVADSGFEPAYCGRIPTPALSLYAFEKGWPSIMVTGSHIPFDRNGIKFNTPTGEVLKSDEAAILGAVDRVRRIEYANPPDRSVFDDDGMFRSGCGTALRPGADEARDDYARRYLNFLPKDALSGMRIVVYEHSAVGRDLLVEILSALGAQVHPMGRTDGFVAIDTEAVSREMLHELERLIDAAPWRPDAIVSTDGDSDRPMVAGVDSESGVRFFSGDLLGIVVADYLRADSIVVPVSATDAIDTYFQDRDVHLVRTRIGSPWVIAAMAAEAGRRCVGWESNGGFLVGSEIEVGGRCLGALPTRDAMLPIVAALHGAKREGITLIELFERLPRRFTRAGLLDAFPSETSRRLLQQFSPGDPTLRRAVFREDGTVGVNVSGKDGEADPSLARRLGEIRRRLGRHFSPDRGFGQIEEIDYLDGIRIYFDNADIAHIRPSGNAPQLRIYATADTEGRAEAIVGLGLAEPDGILREMERT